jgi:hypothetical protein
MHGKEHDCTGNYACNRLLGTINATTSGIGQPITNETTR